MMVIKWIHLHLYPKPFHSRINQKLWSSTRVLYIVITVEHSNLGVTLVWRMDIVIICRNK